MVIWCKTITQCLNWDINIDTKINNISKNPSCLQILYHMSHQERPYTFITTPNSYLTLLPPKDLESISEILSFQYVM